MAETPDTGAGVDPALLEIVVCPADHGDLDLVGAELVCRSCGLAYPVRDGIPVLLVDEARRPG
ncbi:Trm112 family protein [Nocardioides marinquilinus]|uniref:UPF0434 protein GCM10023340_27540 n=1 Tax=Nocardioides marinquilinus TaxID=1210400 RepID=A0ABP9PS06_9ACTN